MFGPGCPTEVLAPSPVLKGGAGSAVALSADGSWVAVGAGRDGRVVVWHVPTKEVAEVLEGHQAPVLALAFRRSGELVSLDRLGDVGVWVA